MKIYLRNPKSLGEGLQRVKNTFGVVGENTSKTLGTRNYKCYDNKYNLDISASGKARESFLSVYVRDYERKVGKNMLGKLSGFFRSYTREFLYDQGVYGYAHKKRTVIRNFQKNKLGDILPGFISKVKNDYKLLDKGHINFG